MTLAAPISICVYDICNIKTNYLKPMLIQYPVTQREFQSDTDGFFPKFGFPQVIGCIHGTHMSIEQPNKNPPDCFSYKMNQTINRQRIYN